jgi:two-component system, sensor histidine kinase RegB
VVSAAVLAFFINRVQQALTRREEELISARDARLRSEKLASLATLAAGAAHEFSTPLSTIALVASELQRGLEGSTAERHFIEDAALIRDQVERCREILRQMSADAGESIGEILRPVAVEELIDHILDGCREPSRVAVHIETRSSAALSVPASALGQALRGLVNNALEASPEGTSIDLVASEGSDSILLEIRDRGSGMAPEVLQRVSEPFFTTKEAGQGMGLGVFLARTLVEKIDGRLLLTSTLGEGTTARVHLPLSRTPGGPHG